MSTYTILVVGDIIGRPGRELVQSRLQGLVDQHRIDLVIANGENAAGGYSITPPIVEELYDAGVKVITTGNHVFDNKDVFQIIDSDPYLLRPANYPKGVPGHGTTTVAIRGKKISVINLMGRTFMNPLDCPFRCFDHLYEEIRDECDIIIVDFHAETTSEKRAFGWYCDGRASAVLGTHTHVQTADEEILEKGTAYITDIGMTGPFDSVIGMNKHQSIDRFLSQMRVRYEVASGDIRMNAVIMTIDSDGTATSIKRIDR